MSFSLFAGNAPGYRGQRHSRVEYAYGLWRALAVAAQARWLVYVYHDGRVEDILSRFRGAFGDSSPLRCIRVDVAPSLAGRRYLGCLFRLLAADDPNVDVFLTRDLDDALDPRGVALLENRWLPDDSSRVHRQAERYDTPFRTHMVNLGWFGQKTARGDPSVRTALEKWLRKHPAAVTDRYTADEEFLTDEWIPTLRRTGRAGRVAGVVSHPYRRGVTAAQRNRDAAWRRFYQNRHPFRVDGSADAVVRFTPD